MGLVRVDLKVFFVNFYWHIKNERLGVTWNYTTQPDISLEDMPFIRKPRYRKRKGQHILVVIPRKAGTSEDTQAQTDFQTQPVYRKLITVIFQSAISRSLSRLREYSDMWWRNANLRHNIAQYNHTTFITLIMSQI